MSINSLCVCMRACVCVFQAFFRDQQGIIKRPCMVFMQTEQHLMNEINHTLIKYFDLYTFLFGNILADLQDKTV